MSMILFAKLNMNAKIWILINNILIGHLLLNSLFKLQIPVLLCVKSNGQQSCQYLREQLWQVEIVRV